MRELTICFKMCWLIFLGIIISITNGDQMENGKCVEVPSFMTGRKIVGGEQADAPIPWQTSIQINGMHHCGGSILDESTILSAAHCFLPISKFGKNGFSVLAGSVSCKSSTAQVRNITQVIFNNQDKYNEKQIGSPNDIVIIKLSSPLEFDQHTKPICLPSNEDYLPEKQTNVNCYVSGWGKIRFHSKKKSVPLRWVNVPPVTNELCIKSYGPKISNSMICAGYEKGGKDSCRGDSGGPYVCINENEEAVLTGIVSWGKGCGWARYPGVYTRVTSYLKWIQTSMVESMDNLDKESYLVMEYFPAAEKDDEEEADPEAEGEHHAKPLNFFQNIFWPLYYPYHSWTEMINSASGIFKINQPIYHPNLHQNHQNFYF